MYIEGSEWSWISNCSLKKSILRLIRNQEAEACATENGNINPIGGNFSFITCVICRMSTSKISNYRILVLAEWITTCDKLEDRLTCASFDKKINLGRKSDEAECEKECEKEGNGKPGCCGWHLGTEACNWNPGLQSSREIALGGGLRCFVFK